MWRRLRELDGLTTEQAQAAARCGVEPWPVDPKLKMGVAKNVFDQQLLPINGLRHPPERGTNGWYIWAGEVLESDDDFFHPLHVKHLAEVCAPALPYLALPPGWRFLVAPGYEDVWFDESLLRLD